MQYWNLNLQIIFPKTVYAKDNNLNTEEPQNYQNKKVTEKQRINPLSFQKENSIITEAKLAAAPFVFGLKKAHKQTKTNRIADKFLLK